MDLDQRYRLAARSYDLISGEPVYRAGRRLGIAALNLRPGDLVLDVGCGTGLNFAGLRAAVGTTGRVVGLDASTTMLRQAAARTVRNRWRNVELVQADATTAPPEVLLEWLGRPCDGVLATYALSLMRSWRAAWRTMLSLTAPAGRLAVVDLQRPMDVPRPAVWLAELACRLGGSDVDAQPWTAVEQDCAGVRAAQVWAGHLQVRSGQPGRESGAGREGDATPDPDTHQN
ncbi:MAG: class I SAM-dependent methyltransferase [Propionibacteriaceae bacterium]